MLRFELDRTRAAALRVYDVAGRLVRSLAVAEWRPMGRQAIPWDGRDGRSRSLPAGAYRCELAAGAKRSTRWVTLVK